MNEVEVEFRPPTGSVDGCVVNARGSGQWVKFKTPLQVRAGDVCPCAAQAFKAYMHAQIAAAADRFSKATKSPQSGQRHDRKY